MKNQRKTTKLAGRPFMGDVMEGFYLLLTFFYFFSLIEQIMHEYTFLVKLQKLQVKIKSPLAISQL